MKRFVLLLVSTCMICTLGGCKKDIHPNDKTLDQQLEEALFLASDGVGTDHYRFPSELAAIPQDPNNPLTEAKVRLGKLLYHETGLATDPKKEEGRFTYSCASCHHAQGGFQANLPQGISDGGFGFGLRGEGRLPNPEYAIAQLDVQPIRTPSALNIAYQPNILWNGQFGATHLNEGTNGLWHENSPKEWNHLGYEGTETQAIAGMEVHRLDMTSWLFESVGYNQLFYDAFGEVGDDTLMSNVYAGLAIAAYERTLLATEAPFQQYLNGQLGALSDTEKEGAVLFFGKAGCYQCHNGPALSSMDFHALGMNELDGEGVYQTNFENQTIHLGRGGFTGQPEDMYKFKVPQLYNLTDSRFYGHGASFRTVRDVVVYKNDAIAENNEVPVEQLADGFVPLQLTDHEIDAIVAFVEHGLYDPNLERYVPPTTLSGYCFPNNDPISGEELGCR